MANTSKGIYYPDNYSVMADVPEDMKKIAESIDTLFKENDTKNEQQNTNIQNNTQNIQNLQKQNTNLQQENVNLQEENTLLKSQIPNGQAVGENITLTDSSNLQYKKFNIGGKSVQDGTPTPGTPVEIRSVGDDGIVEIKQKGKNIFDKNKKAIRNGVSKTILPTGIRAVLIAEQQYKYLGIELGGSELLGKEITIGATITPSSNNEGAVKLYYGNSNGVVTYSSVHLIGTGNQYTTTTIAEEFPDNCDRVWLLLYGNNIGTGNIDDYVDYTNVMVVLENTLGEYEEYKENNYALQISQPLRSLPKGVRDTIEEDGIHRRVGSVVLDSTETWVDYTTQVEGYYKAYTTSKKTNSNFNTNNSLCNYFNIDRVSSSVLSKQISSLSSNHNATYISIPTEIASNKDELKTWLSKNNVEVIYELEEEVIEPYEDNPLLKATSYKNITHIFSTDEVKPVFDITYKKDLETLFNNLNSALVQGGM